MRYPLTLNFTKWLSTPSLWKLVSATIPLTENEIETCAEHLDWNEIASNQQMSCGFIIRHRSRLQSPLLALNPWLSEDTLSDLLTSRIVSGRDLSFRKGLSPDFIRLQRNNLDDKVLIETGYKGVDNSPNSS